MRVGLQTALHTKTSAIIRWYAAARGVSANINGKPTGGADG